MIGPAATAVLCVAVGAWAGGLAGALVGAVVAVALVAGVAVSAALWADGIGRRLEPEDAWANAPCLPGFAALCRAVYRRRLGEPAGS